MRSAISRRLLSGTRPSAKSMERASGLSWADANALMNRPFFSFLAFEYQCRFLSVSDEPCPHCDALRQQLEAEGELAGPAMASSGSSW